MSVSIPCDRPDRPGDFVPMAAPGRPLHLVMLCDERGMEGRPARLDDEAICAARVASENSGVMVRVPLRDVRFEVAGGIARVVTHETCPTCWQDAALPA